MAGPFWPGVQQHYPSLALRRNPGRAGNSLGTAIYRKGGIMDNLRYDWKTRTPEYSWQKTPAGNYTTNAIYRAVIGNYIVMSLYQTDSGRKYGLFLSLNVWKEDGCKTNKECQAQRVASFSTCRRLLPWPWRKNGFPAFSGTRSAFPAWTFRNC